MMNRESMFVTVFVYFQLCLWFFCGSPRVTFNVRNRPHDGLTFIGETEIVFQCCIDNLTNYNLEIKHTNGSATVITENDHPQNCIQYTIHEVRQCDDGEYRCTANYTCADGSVETKVLTQYLNVQIEDTFPQCVRNGTHGEPYKPGDWLLLTCYCRARVGAMCMWHSTVVGTGNSTKLDNSDKSMENGKDVLRVLVHYAASINNKTRYDCIDIHYNSPMMTKFCSIGPENLSRNDTVVNNIPVESKICTIPTIQTTANIQYISTSLMSSELPGSKTTQKSILRKPSRNVYIIIASGAMILFFIVIFIFLVIICRQKANKTNMTENDIDTFNGNTNEAYSKDGENVSSPYYDHKSLPELNINSSVEIDKNDSFNSMGHTYSDPTETRVHSVAKNPEKLNEDYAEISDSINLHYRDSTKTNKGKEWASAYIHPVPPGNTEVERSIELVELPSKDCAEINKLSLRPKTCKFVSGSNKVQTPETRFSQNYSKVNKKLVESDDDHQEDFSDMYAKVDKTRKGKDISVTSEDFSDLYAEVKKPQK